MHQFVMWINLHANLYTDDYSLDTVSKIEGWSVDIG